MATTEPLRQIEEKREKRGTLNNLGEIVAIKEKDRKAQRKRINQTLKKGTT